MDIDIQIERIDNGFILTGKGVTAGKHYYKDLETFVMLSIVEEIREIDKKIKESKMPEEPFIFKLSSNL